MMVFHLFLETQAGFHVLTTKCKGKAHCNSMEGLEMRFVILRNNGQALLAIAK
jgi:hypothetical protein